MLLEMWQGVLCPVKPFITYLAMRDALYPLHPSYGLLQQLSPTYSWIVRCLNKHLVTVVAVIHCSQWATALQLLEPVLDCTVLVQIICYCMYKCL